MGELSRVGLAAGGDVRSPTALDRRGSSDCSKGRLRRPVGQALERSSARPFAARRRRAANGASHQRARFLPVWCTGLCTPGMGVNLWGGSPLYMNPVNVKNIDTNTSRRQGRNREGPSEGSRSAKL